MEREVTKLWQQWHAVNPTKTKNQVLAMIAFQYAKLYYDEHTQNVQREQELLDFIKTYEERLDDIVLDV